MTEAFGGYVCTSAAIDAAIAKRSMLSHPFYQAWEEGTLTKDALRAYSRQYFHHVETFPRAVSAVHSKCPDRDGRRMLADNLAEEEGLGEGGLVLFAADCKLEGLPGADRHDLHAWVGVEHGRIVGRAPARAAASKKGWPKPPRYRPNDRNRQKAARYCSFPTNPNLEIPLRFTATSGSTGQRKTKAMKTSSHVFVPPSAKNYQLQNLQVS